MRRSPAVISALCLAASLAGCLAASDTGLRSADPQERFRAIAAAAETRDPAAVPGLIERLDSEDPGERLLASRALLLITGETRGYDYAAPLPEREKSIRVWAAWARERYGK